MDAARVSDASWSRGSLRGVRISLVLPSLELGGAERQALRLARYLADEAHAHPVMWGFGEPGAVPRLCEEAGVEWRGLPLPPARARRLQLRALAGFIQQLRQVRPDVLLPFSRLPNRVCGLTWRWSGARSCVWNHRDGGTEPALRRVDRLALRQTPLIVANSQHGAVYLSRTSGVDLADIHVVPNGVALDPPQADRQAWRRRLGVDDQAFLACMLANLTRNKDHATLLRAWRRVVDAPADANRRAVLLLAGRFGDTYPALRALVAELGLADEVRFLGQVSDVSGLLQAVDLGVLSSPAEGSPNGLLEPMAAALPVVGTDVPGIREAVGHAGAPCLAPLRNDTRLADIILAYAQDAHARKEAGRANCARIAETYCLDRMGQRMASICAAGLVDRSVPSARTVLFAPHPPDSPAAAEARERAFFHAIRLRNGTNKTTRAHRLDEVNAIVNGLLPSQRPLAILDVAASSGISALEWSESLDRAGIDHRLTAGDACLAAFLLSFKGVHVLVDRTGYPLQFEFASRAIPYPVGRRRALLFPPLAVFAAVARRVLPLVLRAFEPAAAGEHAGEGWSRHGIVCRPTRLVSPRVRDAARLSFIEDDILRGAPSPGRFHVIRAANILNRHYFDEAALSVMTATLRSRLEMDGLLVVCSTNDRHVNHGTVFRLDASGCFQVACRIGQGSELESLVLASCAPDA